MKGKSAKDCYKKGGEVKKHEAKKHEEKKHEEKKAMKASGEKSHARLDKRARGGAISSPLSGAAPKDMRSSSGENN